MLKNIKGFQPVSLIDFPGQITAILFLSGCNMRCQFCHNPELVLTPNQGENFEEEKIFNYLESRRGKIDGLVITGGEPTLQEGLKEFILKVKARGFLVKLDTNGLLPDKLEELIPVVDFVAMDIKSALENYSNVCGVQIDQEKIKRSAELIRAKAKDYEFRSTVVRGLFSKNDFVEICNWLKGSKKYVIQQFDKRPKLINDDVKNSVIYTKEEMSGFQEYCREYFDIVELRNI
jgi:pyruvate formate lyase activating enzyme